MKILLLLYMACHLATIFYCSIRPPSAYSLRLHCFIDLEHPKGYMHATLGARLFSIAAPPYCVEQLSHAYL